MNLMLNAVQAVDEEGRITVRLVGCSDHDEPAVRLEVEDNGAGMPPNTIARIFDPFFTSHKEGFGLGLFISKTIVERHKGVLGVESSSHLGTRMSVTFPAIFESISEVPTGAAS